VIGKDSHKTTQDDLDSFDIDNIDMDKGMKLLSTCFHDGKENSENSKKSTFVTHRENHKRWSGDGDRTVSSLLARKSVFCELVRFMKTVSSYHRFYFIEWIVKRIKEKLQKDEKGTITFEGV
jgi:hypothetical protein